MWSVQVRVEMAVLPAVTSVLLYNSAMDRGSDGNVVSKRYRSNGVSDCSNFSAVISHC